MLRLRVPACEITATQLHGLADLAHELGGGYAHITTRGNLQIREFKRARISSRSSRECKSSASRRGAPAATTSATSLPRPIAVSPRTN